MAGNSTQSAGRSVISKAVALLDAFSPATRELSLNELAHRTGLPLSTSYRLASELVEWGGLERGEGGGYRIGLRLWEIGALATRPSGIREVALPFMQDLYEATGENVQLAVLDRHEALYIEKIAGRRSVEIKSEIGGRLPLHATGAGKVLLAHASEALVVEVLTAGLKRYTPHTIVEPGRLRKALAMVRRFGIAYAREEMTLGSVSVASPVFGVDGSVVAAMSIVVRSTRADVRRLGPAVHTAALCASRESRACAGDTGTQPARSERFAAAR